MNKTLLKSRKVKIICLFMTVILIAGAVGITSKAQTERRASNIKSKGIFDYANGTVVMDSSDLVYLADEIDLLEETYKKETVKALNKMNTYFLLDDYSTTHNPEEDNLASDSAGALTFSSIIDGILESQSIPAEKTYTGTLPGNENEVTGNISAATEESLSLGDAAWVDGELVVGTGMNNKDYYNRGYADGMAGLVHGQISYVTHSHTDECYVSCTVTYASSLGISSGEGNACVCGETKGKFHKWTLSHFACGQTGDTIEWIICSACGRGDHPGTGTGSVERVHNALICGKTEGQIESALIVYP